MKIFNLEQNRKGFTIIELLVVIAIIGILAATVTVSLNTAKKRAKDAQVKNNMRQIRIMAENYKLNSAKGDFAGITQCYTGGVGDRKCYNEAVLSLQDQPWVKASLGDDIDKSKAKISDLVGKTEKVIGTTAAGNKVLLRGEGGTPAGARFVAFAILPSKMTNRSDTTTWLCVDSAGGSKEYTGYNSIITAPAGQISPWASGYCK